MQESSLPPISNFKITYTPGPLRETKGSPQIIPYLKELKVINIPRDVNDIRYYFNNTFSPEEVKEILRRFAGVYHTAAEARFNLAAAQIKRYSNFLSDDSSDESHLWVSSVFVNNALINYQSLFDLILQVSWFYYRIYTYFNVSKENQTKLSLSTSNLLLILQKCKWENVLKHKDILEANYFSLLKQFYESAIYSKVNNLANSLKHRNKICYDETMIEDQFLINCNDYSSAETLKSHTLEEIVSVLKEYHNAIYDVIKLLCETHKLK